MRLGLVTHNVTRGQGQSRVNLETVLGCLSAGWGVTLFADEVDEEVLEAGARWVKVVSRVRTPMLARVWEFGQRADRAVEKHRGELDVLVGTGFSLTRPHDVNVSHFVHSAWREVRSRCGDGRAGLHRLNQSVYTASNASWEKAAYRKAGRVIAVSGLVREELAGIGVPRGAIEVIENGVDLDEYAPGVGDREAVGLPGGVPMAVFVGDIRTRRKNLDTVLEAVRRLEGVHLAVVGRMEKSAFPAMASAMGIADRVHFLGFRRDVAAIMRAGDVFVFPSRYEPFGLVVLEALACGRPVVTARTTGACGVVTEGVGSVIEDPDDAGALAAAMRPWLKGERGGVSGAARSAAERYAWSRMAERYLEVFTAAAGREREVA